MASQATEEMIETMVKTARAGYDIIPMFFQPLFGTNASVGAAIRVGVKRGVIEQNGVDGMGKPKYRLVLPKQNAPTTRIAQ